MNARSETGTTAPGGLAALLFGPDAPADDAIVARAGTTTLTASVARRRARDLAGALHTDGVASGDPIALLASSDLDVLAAYFAIWLVGGITIPINPRLTSTEVMRLLDATAAAHVVGHDGDLARHQSAIGDRPQLSLDATVTAAPFDPSDEPTTDVAIILTTSGTTGTPKPVQLRHAGVLDGIDAVLQKLTGGRPIDPAKVRPPNIIPVPLALWAGIYNVLFAWRSHSSVILLDPFTTNEFTAVVREHHIASSVLAPPMIAMLSADEAIDDLAPLRFVRSITAPLSPLHAQRFHDRFGISVLNSYGQTELGGEVIGWNAADARAHGTDKLGALGRPHEGVDLAVLERDEPVAPGGDGELCVRTPSMMAGYLDPAAESRMTADGFLRTGDIGHVDAEGFVWLSGRVSDLIIRGGLKVFPAEVDEVLRLHPDVADAAVVGVPDDRLGEVPVAFVACDTNAQTEEELAPELEALARQYLAPYKVPVRFFAIDQLPRNEVGKVLRPELVRRAVEAAES